MVGQTGRMTVLVTGGAGYIGSHTVRLLVEQGRDVVVLDNMEFGHKSAVLGADLVVGDTRDSELVGRLVRDRGIDAVIHFAAYKAPGESMEDPGRYFDNNVGSTGSLLAALTAAGVRHFVFSSTCAVYGTPSIVPVDEDHPLGPESPYGESKLMVERMLHWYGVCKGLRSVSLRYFNAAGASFDARIGEDWTVTLNLVPVALKATILQQQPLRIFGTDYPTPDGTAIRDYIHVVDLADAHLRALAHLESGGDTDVFNLGTGQGSSVLEVVSALERVSGQTVPTERVDRRPGDPVRVWADNRRAAEVLGWKPQYGLEEIVRTAWDWHSSHPQGYPD